MRPKPSIVERAAANVLNTISVLLFALVLAYLIAPETTAQSVSSGTVNSRTQDKTGAGIDSATTTPAGTERGLIVRNIPGTLVQPVKTDKTTPGTTDAVAVDRWLGSTAPTVGSKTSANSIPVVIASDQGSVPTTQGAFTTIATGQQSVTASAVALPSNAGKMVCLRVNIGGTQTVYVGPTGVTTSNGYGLEAGDFQCFALTNSSSLFVIAANTGSAVHFFVLA